MLVGKNITEDYTRKFCLLGQEDIKISLLKIFFATLKDRGFRAVALYRAGRSFRNGGYIILAKLIERLIHRLCYCEISTTADIGPGFRIYHPFGLVIGSDLKAGKNFNIRLGSTFGGRRGKFREDGSHYPIIGDNATVAGGVRVIGPVEIGNNCIIGANSVVISDIPSDCVAAGVPARIIKRNGQKVSLLEQDGRLSEILRDLLSRTEKLENQIEKNKHTHN